MAGAFEQTTLQTPTANRGSLPSHLVRIEEIIEPESLICVCGGYLHRIGEDVSERLDVIPAQFRVIVTRGPKYACRACTDGVDQAPAPARLIQAGLPTQGDYHLLPYRQAQIMSRQGIDLDSSTLADWVGRTGFELRPVFHALIADLKRTTKVFMGETRAPIILCRKGGAGTVRNHGRVPQPELKMTFAETVEERNVLAQRPITIEIIVSATKCPEDIVANAFELLASGDLEANPVAA